MDASHFTAFNSLIQIAITLNFGFIWSIAMHQNKHKKQQIIPSEHVAKSCLHENPTVASTAKSKGNINEFFLDRIENFFHDGLDNFYGYKTPHTIQLKEFAEAKHKEANVAENRSDANKKEYSLPMRYLHFFEQNKKLDKNEYDVFIPLGLMAGIFSFLILWLTCLFDITPFYRNLYLTLSYLSIISSILIIGLYDFFQYRFHFAYPIIAYLFVLFLGWIVVCNDNLCIWDQDYPAYIRFISAVPFGIVILNSKSNNNKLGFIMLFFLVVALFVFTSGTDITNRLLQSIPFIHYQINPSQFLHIAITIYVLKVFITNVIEIEGTRYESVKYILTLFIITGIYIFLCWMLLKTLFPLIVVSILGGSIAMSIYKKHKTCNIFAGISLTIFALIYIWKYVLLQNETIHPFWFYNGIYAYIIIFLFIRDPFKEVTHDCRVKLISLMIISIFYSLDFLSPTSLSFENLFHRSLLIAFFPLAYYLSAFFSISLGKLLLYPNFIYDKYNIAKLKKKSMEVNEEENKEENETENK